MLFFRWFFASDVLVREAEVDEVLRANAYMIIYEKLNKEPYILHQDQEED